MTYLEGKDVKGKGPYLIKGGRNLNHYICLGQMAGEGVAMSRSMEIIQNTKNITTFVSHMFIANLGYG